MLTVVQCSSASYHSRLSIQWLTCCPNGTLSCKTRVGDTPSPVWCGYTLELDIRYDVRGLGISTSDRGLYSRPQEWCLQLGVEQGRVGDRWSAVWCPKGDVTMDPQDQTLRCRYADPQGCDLVLLLHDAQPHCRYSSNGQNRMTVHIYGRQHQIQLSHSIRTKTRQGNVEQVLLPNWQLGGVPYHNGWVSFSWPFILLNTPNQSFTHVTNLSTSRHRIGRLIVLPQCRGSFEMNTTEHTLRTFNPLKNLMIRTQKAWQR